MPNRPIHTCVRCANRKVKCDRQKPCSACVKHKVDCVFSTVEQPRKRQRRVKEQILTDRIKQYEAILQERGIDSSKIPSPSASESYPTPNQITAIPEELLLQTPASTVSEPRKTVIKTQLLQGQGRSKFVENSLWTRVAEEFQDPKNGLADSSDEGSDADESDDDLDFVLGNPSRSRDDLHHPPPERINQLWQVYIENVDPLTKVIHVPTLRPAVQKAVEDTKTMPRSFEALMFAIYSISVMTLDDDDCRQRLGEPRKSLLSRYVSATKVALSRAKFMGTTSLVVLQALVLHLLTVRDFYEPRALWTLTGVAVRIAQGMGLERDGETLGLSPFETELRRRIWWLMKTHDFRTAELCGLAKFRDLDTGYQSTKWPTNINDDQLYPNMTSLQVESKPVTDCIFISLRYELMAFAGDRINRFREQGKKPSDWELRTTGSERTEINEASKELEELLETKYLRYCDPSHPLQLLVMLMARFALNVVRFLTNHPRRWSSLEETPFTERQYVWDTSMKLLEQHSMLQCNPQLKQFTWHAAFFMQWHAYIHVLDTLRASPLMADADKAWQLIGNTYERTPEMIFETKKPVHVAVGNLCLKAYSARELALRNALIHAPPTPEFILRLRQQREVARAKKQARDSKRTQVEPATSHGQADIHDNSFTSNPGVIHLSDTLDSTHLQQNTIPHQSNPTQIPFDVQADPFWFINGFDNSQVGHLNSMMDIDTDFMLMDDYNMADNAGQPVNWEQWDSWLADSNAMRASTG